MSSVKRASICSLCVALCALLPLVFHATGTGAALSPMHIPVLLCGLVCGWSYGAFCGAAGCIISSLVSGMPSTAQLVYMVPELMAYGLVCGLLMRLVRTGHTYADVYISLAVAMAIGRIAGGAARAAFYLSMAQDYSLALWAAGYLAGTAPAIVLQLVLIPVLYLVLTRAKLIPQRYPGGQKS